MISNVCPNGKAPNFFLLSHSPHFPPFEAPQIGLGKWPQHDKLAMLSRQIQLKSDST